MLLRTDPFRELDRFAQQFFGNGSVGTWSKPSPMPMDAYRDGDEFVVAFDIPGVDPEAIDIDVERNTLTVKAERRPHAESDEARVELSERPLGAFSRRLVLSDTLDTERITADYDAGVLTVRIPVAERAKPRKVAVNTGKAPQEITG